MNINIKKKMLISVFGSVLLLIVTGFTGLYFTSQVSKDSMHVGVNLAPAAESVLESMLSMANAHLLFEEIMGGDTGESINDVWDHIDESKWYIEAMLNGGKNDKHDVVAVDDELIKKGIIDMSEKIDVFEASAKARHTNFLNNVSTGAGSKADALFDRYYEEFIVVAEQTEKNINNLIKKDLKHAQDASDRAWTLMVVIVIIGTIISLTMGFVISNSITKPLNKVADAADSISKGDLTIQDIDITNKDEVGSLTESVNIMKSNLAEVIGKIRSMSEKLATAMTELAASSNQMAAGAEEQSSQTAQVATSVEQMSATIIEVAKNSQNASELATKTEEIAERGGKVVTEAIEGMASVSESVKGSTEIVRKLDSSSEQIGQIVGVINDIADQTNLLALNAAIEAARAGEQGRGFAVVADEVRKLAEKTSTATKEIAEMITNIQSETRGAMESMNKGTKLVEVNMDLANNAGDALREIVASVQGVSSIVRQIATAAEEQSSAAEEISSNVAAISSVAEQSAQGALQTKEAAEDLNVVSEDLKSTVGKFKVAS